MTQKNKKQFGVWMDTHHATVVGRINAETEIFSVLGSAVNSGAEHNTSEKNEHNDEKTLQHKFFKEILSYMQNAEEVHLTGTGVSQEQLMHYMAATAQFIEGPEGNCLEAVFTNHFSLIKQLIYFDSSDV